MAVLETLQQAAAHVQEQQGERDSVSTALREQLSSLLKDHTSRRVPKYMWPIIAMLSVSGWFIYPTFCALARKVLNPIDIITVRKLTSVVDDEGKRLTINISSSGGAGFGGMTMEIERASRLRLCGIYYPEKPLELVAAFDPRRSKWGQPRLASTEELLTYQRLVGEVQRSLPSKPTR